jgi:pimeloyl-ACP methyl ester carboxylesterase
MAVLYDQRRNISRPRPPRSYVSTSQHQQIRLRSGRALAYLEFGSPRGLPILYCHGTPSSRVEGCLTMPAEAVADLNARVIIPDRPGMGYSDFMHGRRIVDWPSDVVELGDALGIDSFAVLGSSGGAPFALACAALIPHRVRVVGVIGAVAPVDVPGVPGGASLIAGRLASYAPALVRGLTRLQLLALRSEGMRKQMANAFPEPDRSLFQRREIRDGFISCFQEACRNGTRGAVWEQHLLARPWGFDLRQIKTPTLLWQGERDGNVSSAGARYLANTIPGCIANFYPDEAHISVIFNHRREILGELTRRF